MKAAFPDIKQRINTKWPTNKKHVKSDEGMQIIYRYFEQWSDRDTDKQHKHTLRNEFLIF